MAAATPPHLSTDDGWAAIGKASDAVLDHVTPAGAPRTSTVVRRTVDRRSCVAVAPGSWKDRHLRQDGCVPVA